MHTIEEFMNPKPTLLRRGLLAAAVACAACVIAAPVHAAFSITETDADSFRYSTAPGWTTSGSMSGGLWTPQLTVPGIDTNEGDGWLRLTENKGHQKGMAVYSTAFSSAEGLEIIFDYATYGNDSDGMGFFLFDGSAATANTGYWSVHNDYVSVWLDEYGNFSRPTDTTPSCSSPCPDRQSVVVRGASSLNLPPLKTVSLLPPHVLGRVSPVDRPGRTVRITISPVSSAAPYPTVTVAIDPTGTGTGFVPVTTVALSSSNGAVPATFKMGFKALTIGSASHPKVSEVRIKRARTFNALSIPVPALGQGVLGALTMLLALLTLPALRRRVR
jgi:hypothetical protein